MGAERNSQEGRRVVLQLLRDFQPDLLAVEHAFFVKNRNTALLNVFVDEIRALARQNGIVVRSLAPSTVKKGICGDGAATKRQVSEAVVARYPDLKVYLGQDRKWKERFHGNMFDAVAIGILGSDAVSRTQGAHSVHLT